MPALAPRPLAIDIGASKLEYALAGAKGARARIARIAIPAKMTSGRLVQLIVRICKKSRATSLGICFPGFVHDGKVLKLPNLPDVRAFDAKSVLGRKLSIPVSVENDAKCMALAVWHARGRKEDDDFIVIAPGSGIGGAIVRNGRLVRGEDNQAGEFGHMKILLARNAGASGASGHGGSRGASGPGPIKEEWEQMCGGFGIARRYALALKEKNSTKNKPALSALPNDARDISPPMRNPPLFSSLPARDRDAKHILHSSVPLAKKISNQSAAYFGLGLALIASALEPREFVIAGSVGAAYVGPLRKKVTAAFEANASDEAKDTPISPCPIPHPALWGAALLSRYGL
ncbi:MAG: ROK family protein [Candidatus Micrarchaeota archaeon]